MRPGTTSVPTLKLSRAQHAARESEAQRTVRPSCPGTQPGPAAASGPWGEATSGAGGPGGEGPAGGAAGLRGPQAPTHRTVCGPRTDVTSGSRNTGRMPRFCTQNFQQEQSYWKQLSWGGAGGTAGWIHLFVHLSLVSSGPTAMHTHACTHSHMHTYSQTFHTHILTCPHTLVYSHIQA